MTALPSTRELRALDVVEVVPAGCFGLLITDDAWLPHLCPDELAVVDTSDTAAQPGELYAIGKQGIDCDQTRIVQVCRLDPDTVEPGAVAFRHELRRPGVMILMDGPISAAGWAERGRGRVGGVTGATLILALGGPTPMFVAEPVCPPRY